MRSTELGLRANWKQFTLLVVLNAFVGAMVGLERTVLPVLAELEFGVASHAAALSFIMAFGVSKALANYFTGRLAGRFGRKKLLVFGWALALPVPFMIIHADAWSTVVLANILLGIHQGFFAVLKIPISSYFQSCYQSLLHFLLLVLLYIHSSLMQKEGIDNQRAIWHIILIVIQLTFLSAFFLSCFVSTPP